MSKQLTNLVVTVWLLDEQGRPLVEGWKNCTYIYGSSTGELAIHRGSDGMAVGVYAKGAWLGVRATDAEIVEATP